MVKMKHETQSVPEGSAPVDSDDPTSAWPLCAVCGKTAREGNHCTDLGVGHDYVPSQVSGTDNGSGERR